MFQIDLNCDLGESFGRYNLGSDEDILPLISSCNIACGFHASDPCVMNRTAAMAAECKIGIGAHPGFPDLMGFGRRNMTVSAEEAEAYVMYQVGALSAFAAANGVRLQHVKPHGALYNMAAKDYTLALAIAKAVQKIDESLILMGLAGSKMIQAAKEIDLPYAQEVFADRGYQSDGTLVPRSQPNALIADEQECVRRITRMVKENKVTAVTGEDIAISADSICVHGDGAKALAFVRALRENLLSAGIQIVPLKKQM